MQLTPRTLAILKNFVYLNPGIVFKPGIEISTGTVTMDVVALAQSENKFIKQFAISDLSQFLQVMSSFSNPELEFDEKVLFIREGEKEIRYTYGDEQSIKTPPGKSINMPKILASFSLTESELTGLTRIAGVMHFTEIAIVSDKKKLTLQALDMKNPTGNIYKQKCTNGEGTSKFISAFAAEKINLLMSMDYNVTIGKGVAEFKGKDVTYWIAPQAKFSTYED